MQQKEFFQRLHEQQKALESHRVFDLLKTVDDLRLFMSWHVFAVWDFMSLVKRLQRELTVVSTPWVPSPRPKAARLINEIVLSEESDLAPDGRCLSHYELYLEAMREIGADTSVADRIVSAAAEGKLIEDELQAAGVHPAVQQFVKQTLNTAQVGEVEEVLGNFFFGREEVIPRMFQSLLDHWHLAPEQAPIFTFYLKRHIELDGDEHGPAALELLESFVGDDAPLIDRMEKAAVAAINARIAFWDGLADVMTLRVNPYAGG